MNLDMRYYIRIWFCIETDQWMVQKICPSKDYKEQQADKFAAYFLMLKKSNRKSLKTDFLTNSFTINQNTALSLGYRLSDLKKRMHYSERFNKKAR